MSNKGIRFKDKNGNAIYPYPFMPVGSVFKSTSSTNPSTYFGGNWALVYSGYERQQVGSEVLYSNLHGSTNVSKTNLIGSYDFGTFGGLFDNISVPSGCHREYRLIFQGSTGGDNQITVFLNNIATSGVHTWSSDTFRVIGASNYFKQSDIILETTMGYSRTGVNLKYQVTGASNRWDIFYISIQAFITSDVQIYTWRRTS